MDDVRKVFETFKGRPYSDLAVAFWRGSPEATNGSELRRHRIRLSELLYQVQEMESKYSEQQRLCGEVKAALEAIDPKDKTVMQLEADRREGYRVALQIDLDKAKNECRVLDNKVCDQEAYIYRSELLHLLSSRRCALDPHNLATGLAGLPDMKWRQSQTRCSSLPEQSFVYFPYRIFQVISRIWARRTGEFQEAPTEFFRSQVLNLPKMDRDVKERACKNWRDLRLAIEDCWKSKHPSAFVPYAISSGFINNLNRQKGSIDRILDAQEVLSPP